MTAMSRVDGIASCCGGHDHVGKPAAVALISVPDSARGQGETEAGDCSAPEKGGRSIGRRGREVWNGQPGPESTRVTSTRCSLCLTLL
jgi:hypothetical protein